MAPTVLYYSRGACSWAPHTLLEEIEEPFEARRIDASKGENRTPEYLKLHPRAHVPVLVQGDFVLTEAAAIMVHLADNHPAKKLIPAPGSQARARAHEWCGFLASAVHVAFRDALRPERVSDDPSTHPAIVASSRATLQRHYAEVETRLRNSGGRWALGNDYSLVDPYVLVMFRWGHRIQIEMKTYERWSEHANAMLARPAVQRSMAREEITLTGMK
jgi:glutathione S-transferase